MGEKEEGDGRFGLGGLRRDVLGEQILGEKTNWLQMEREREGRRWTVRNDGVYDGGWYVSSSLRKSGETYSRDELERNEDVDLKPDMKFGVFRG